MPVKDACYQMDAYNPVWKRLKRWYEMLRYNYNADWRMHESIHAWYVCLIECCSWFYFVLFFSLNYRIFVYQLINYKKYWLGKHRLTNQYRILNEKNFSTVSQSTLSVHLKTHTQNTYLFSNSKIKILKIQYFNKVSIQTNWDFFIYFSSEQKSVQWSV